MAITTDRILDILVPTQCSMDDMADAGTTSDDTTVGTEVDSKVKTKLLSMWNNVKYGLYVQNFYIFYIFMLQISFYYKLITETYYRIDKLYSAT